MFKFKCRFKGGGRGRFGEWGRMICVLLAGVMGVGMARGQDPSLRFGGQIPPDVDRIYERGLAWLANAQDADGSWKGNNEGCGVTGICLMAFLASGEDPNYGKYAENIHRAIYSIINAQDATTGYLPDSMYHHGFGMLALSEAYGAVDESLFPSGQKPPRSIAEALKLAIGCAANVAKEKQHGSMALQPGRPDADTSVSGAVLMGLLAARNAGMNVPDDVMNGAMDYMRRSTGSDGSVAYSGGFGGMEGSMNLTAMGRLRMRCRRRRTRISTRRRSSGWRITWIARKAGLTRSISAITWRRRSSRGTMSRGRNGTGSSAGAAGEQHDDGSFNRWAYRRG